MSKKIQRRGGDKALSGTFAPPTRPSPSATEKFQTTSARARAIQTRGTPLLLQKAKYLDNGRRFVPCKRFRHPGSQHVDVEKTADSLFPVSPSRTSHENPLNDPASPSSPSGSSSAPPPCHQDPRVINKTDPRIKIRPYTVITARREPSQSPQHQVADASKPSELKT